MRSRLYVVIVMMMDVDLNLRRRALSPLRRLTLSPLRTGALAAAKLLPSLKERLLSLHDLREVEIGLGQGAAAVGRANLGLRKTALRHTDWRPAGGKAADGMDQDLLRAQLPLDGPQQAAHA